jgi:hypothetical protein
MRLGLEQHCCACTLVGGSWKKSSGKGPFADVLVGAEGAATAGLEGAAEGFCGVVQQLCE